MEAYITTKSALKLCAYIALISIVCSAGRVLAQIPARKGPASPEEISKARAVLDTNLNNFKSHQAYIYAMGIINPLVVEQYREFIKKYPENVNIPMAAGTVFYNAEMPQAKEFLLKVVEMQPGNAKVWSMLSFDAERWGQKDMAIAYTKKATEANPADAGYAFDYLWFFAHGDQNDYKQKVFEFIKRFPANEHGAQALYWLGVYATNINDKISYFEELRKLFPPQKFKWSLSGMIQLSDAYLQTDPAKALALINEMGGDKDWAIRQQVAERLIRVNKLEEDQNYKDAIAELDSIRLPKYNQVNDYIVLKKSTLLGKIGDAKAAYDSIAVQFAKLPEDKLYTELELFGKRTGKDKKQIEEDIETIRNRTAVPAYPFELGLYNGDGKLNLESLKGKVVLLTFWFPACAPCRAEFPHFESVIDKFKGKNVVYIGINVFPEQDPYVVPFIKNTKYSFIPLRGSAEFAAKYYNVTSEPENFLIDQTGKIVFKNFRITDTNHRTLELMISSLLQKGS